MTRENAEYDKSAALAPGFFLVQWPQTCQAFDFWAKGAPYLALYCRPLGDTYLHLEEAYDKNLSKVPPSLVPEEFRYPSGKKPFLERFFFKKRKGILDNKGPYVDKTLYSFLRLSYDLEKEFEDVFVFTRDIFLHAVRRPGETVLPGDLWKSRWAPYLLNNPRPVPFSLKLFPIYRYNAHSPALSGHEYFEMRHQIDLIKTALGLPQNLDSSPFPIEEYMRW